MTAQEVKNSILHLAIQGKLLPQDPEDENASELIKRIRDERSKWIMEGRIKKEKPLAAIEEDEITAELPDSWVWCRVGEVFVIVRGITFPSEAKNTVNGPGLVPCATTGSVQDTYNYNADVFISEQFVKRKDQWLLPNDIIMSTANSRELVGKTCIWTSDERKTFGGFLTVLRPGTGILPKYAYYALMSIKASGAFLKTATQTTNIANINTRVLQNTLFPLPPFNEQARIVNKIEELLPLAAEYDEAEQKLSALNANFPEMLRKSILQQAVQGKITARDPSDEPAAELLRRSQTEKAKLIAEGKIKKEKPLPPITEDDCPFEIPDTWQWVRLGDIVRYQGGYAYKSDTYVKQSNNQVIRLGNVKNSALLLNASPVYIPEHIAEETEEYRIEKDTILFTMTGTKGKRDYFYTCKITEDNTLGCKLYLNQRVGCLRPYSGIDLDWLIIVLQSEAILSQIFATATGNANQANIGSANTLKLMIPLPPLAEQNRIVARVKDLLATCNTL